MMKVYRVLEHSSYGADEKAFFSSFLDAADYVFETLKDKPDIQGRKRKPDVWTKDRSKDNMFFTLRDGYTWYRMAGAYGVEGYSIEEIIVKEGGKDNVSNS